MTVSIDPRIEEFGKLVNQGISAFQAAGALLIELCRDNPQAHADIIERNPHLTFEILEAFERIGRRELYPFLLMDGSAGCRRLAGLPYEDQERLYHSEVSVVVKRTSSLETIRKRVSNLTPQEADRVFDTARMRSVSEQKAILLPDLPASRGLGSALRSHLTIRSSIEPAPAIQSIQPVARPVPQTPITDDGSTLKADLATHLKTAQNALLEARSSLALIQRDNKYDKHIGFALGAIGEIRFALNNGDIKPTS